MSYTKTSRWVLASVLLLALFLPSAAPVSAQGCVMCYTSASQLNDKAARALNLGILALLSPTLLLFGGIFFLANRHRISDGQGSPDSRPESSAAPPASPGR